MWARVIEAMLGVWLIISPFVFRHPSDATALWTSDLVSGSAVITLALLSYWEPTRHAHVLLLVVATWLIGFGRFWSATPLPPGQQNDIVIGLLLLMFAIIPNQATLPPRAWFRELPGPLG